MSDALICGAGPVGLMMALELCRHGMSVRIIDKAAEACHQSRALAVWPRTVEIYEHLGCLESMLAVGNPVHGASLYSEGKKLVHVGFDSLNSPFRWCLMIAQYETERVLAAHLEKTYGVKVERRVELETFEQRGDRVEVVLRRPEDGSEEEWQVPWLLGCDGAHSKVRHGLQMPFQGTTNPTDWALADVHERSGAYPEDEATMFFHPEGVAAVFPFAGQRYRLIIDLGEHQGEGKRPDPTLEEVQAVVERRTSKSGLKLCDPVWLASFTINERKVQDYRRGRIFLAGDAAHVHSPAGGQGMNTGLQDAYNLAWKLAMVHHGKAHETLLDSYTQERSAVGDLVLRNAGALTFAATLRNPVAQGIRDRIWSVVGGVDWFQRKISETMGELNIHYPRSPLSRESGKSLAWLVGKGVHAGDRLPDGELERAGAPVRLFELLRNTRFNLLMLEGMELEPGVGDRLEEIRAAVEARFPGMVVCHHIGGAGLTDRLDRVHKALGAAHSSLYLVRPDGYVGFRGQPAEGGPLLEYLTELLIPAAVSAP